MATVSDTVIVSTETTTDPHVETTLYKRVGDIKIFHRRFRIGDFGPGLDDIASITAEAGLSLLDAIQSETLHCYLNPAWTVTAPGTVDELTFLKEADKSCVLWMTRLRHSLGNGPVKRLARTMQADAACLATCGILFLAGKEAHTKRLNWRARKQTR